MNNQLPQKKDYKRKFEVAETTANDLEAIMNLAIESTKKGRPPKYSDSEEGLALFKENSLGYLEYVRSVNNSPDNERVLIPDIESWACFLGITRQRIFDYEKERNEEWIDFIKFFKNLIASFKKQLAFGQRIPPVIAMFDLTNNHGYVNSSEYHLLPEKPKEETSTTFEDLPPINTLFDTEGNEAK